MKTKKCKSCNKELPMFIEQKYIRSATIVLKKSGRKYCSDICRNSSTEYKEKKRADNAKNNPKYHTRISRDCLHCGRPTYVQTAIWCVSKPCREDWEKARKETKARPLTDEVKSWGIA